MIRKCKLLVILSSSNIPYDFDDIYLQDALIIPKLASSAQFGEFHQKYAGFKSKEIN